MTAQLALQIVLQMMALWPTLEPAFVQGVKDFEALIAGGAATQSDIDALIARVQYQSRKIQNLT